ncbi:hypothetical protein NDI76_00100 [Halogeometricum sp. S1BR25-6]|uniref:Uncharacterized protein n=1 Tax=Halogeometricum salsisoli TaxID=2950536 RepID=A0ABU2G8L0_9EURY|nr:hypothetical protein [Halogeometricum sp. S1BR25-6]MDS0297140.1 hypothetical protein [Halogeometricum sp. S1BR25-6]
MDPYNRLDRGQLPYHWHVVSSRDCLGFRHRERSITVEAVEADGPRREFEGRWQLQCRQQCNEAESQRIVGHVTTESEALSALFTWMERINTAAAENEATVDVVGLGKMAAADTAPQSSTHWVPDENDATEPRDPGPQTRNGRDGPKDVHGSGPRERIRK